MKSYKASGLLQLIKSDDIEELLKAYFEMSVTLIKKKSFLKVVINISKAMNKVKVKLLAEDLLNELNDDCNKSFQVHEIKFKNVKYTRDEILVCIEDWFDFDYYRRTYWWDFINSTDESLIGHFIECGDYENRNPAIWFDTKFYKTKYSIPNGQNAFVHYLKIGRYNGNITNIIFEDHEFLNISKSLLNLDQKRVSEQLVEIYKDKIKRLNQGELSKQIEIANDIDPLITHSLLDAHEIRYPLLTNQSVNKQSNALIQIFKILNFSTFKSIIILPWIKMGGADKEAGFVAKALADEYGSENVLVFLTDDGIEQNDFFPEGLTYVHFYSIARDLNLTEKLRVLFELIRCVKIEFIINVNSVLFLDFLDLYHIQLKDTAKTATLIFCDDRNYYGDIDGFPSKYFVTMYEKLDLIFTDSQYLIRNLCDKYLLSEKLSKKLIRLDAPVDEKIKSYKSIEFKDNESINIFWAGRFDKQKRVDIPLELAKRNPNWTFHVWGKPVLNDTSLLPQDLPSNFILNKPFSSITDIKLDECTLWLYTSEWDGVPNLLIEVAALGIPLVGTNKCGGSDLLNNDFSYVVEDINNMFEYERKINEVINNLIDARQKAYVLKGITINRRTADKFNQTLLSNLNEL